MSFYATLGYGFKIPSSVEPSGSVILASAMPVHQLERRNIDARYPHMQRRFFDPQLYLAGLDASASRKHCANLATYPWFGVQGLATYQSDEHTQNSWSEYAREQIPRHWTGSAPSDLDFIRRAVRDCIDFELALGVEGVILPSPLTVDPSTAYSRELTWVDEAVAYLDSVQTSVPVFATVALANLCVRYSDPTDNALIDLILDNISARDVDGVYIVVEQGSEAQNGRQCTSTRTLWSALELCHLFHKIADCG